MVKLTTKPKRKIKCGRGYGIVEIVRTKNLFTWKCLNGTGEAIVLSIQKRVATNCKCNREDHNDINPIGLGTKIQL